MAPTSVQFISQKVHKIRWRPPSEENFLGTNVFITGSWGKKPNNELALWQCQSSDAGEVDFNPTPLCSVKQSEDVCDIKFMNSDKVLAATSEGTVDLYSVTANGPGLLNKQWKLNLSHSWRKIHQLQGQQSPCTSLACFGEEIATVGEDGRIVFLNANRKEPTRTIEKGDSGWLTCVCYLKHNEVLAANMRGQLKVWDLLSSTERPSSLFSLTEDRIVGITCLAQHPTQGHIVATGMEDGSIAIWDVRKEKFPVTLLRGHDFDVSEIKFHPLNPDHLFTCSQDGQIWHWNGASAVRNPSAIMFQQPQQLGLENSWLSGDVAENRVEITSIITPCHLPVNSLDIQQATLICGADNEAIYVTSQLPVY